MALRFRKEKFMADVKTWDTEEDIKEYEEEIANGTSWVCCADGQIVNPKTWSVKGTNGVTYWVDEDWCSWDESNDKDVARAIKRHKERRKDDTTKGV